MSVKIKAEYIGDDQVELTHTPSNTKIITDLPVDNGGRGRTFSPTDLVASALSSCILTIMSKIAQKEGVDMKGTLIEIEKEMGANPRRISVLKGKITFPKGIPENKKEKLLSAIKSCPVTKSLHPDIKIEITET